MGKNLFGRDEQLKISRPTGRFVWKEAGDLDWNREEFQKDQPIFTDTKGRNLVLYYEAMDQLGSTDYFPIEVLKEG